MATLYQEIATNVFQCPFCGENKQNTVFCGPIDFDCLGRFRLDIELCAREINSHFGSTEERLFAWAKLGHYIAQNYLDYKSIAVSEIKPINFKWVLENTNLPMPAEQADNLLIYIAKHTKYLGCNLRISYSSLQGYQIQAWTGMADSRNLREILRNLVDRQLLLNVQPFNQEYCDVKLSVEGWNRVQQLKQVNIQSRQVFMAMQFNPIQQEFIRNTLVPKIQEMGFELKLLSDIKTKENLIDNKLRESIKKSRFVICDLTHGNQGAYWEAGYAEGLGLPVIYICERKAFDTPKQVHFDVNHQEVYTWKREDDNSIESFLEQLQAKIFVLTH